METHLLYLLSIRKVRRRPIAPADFNYMKRVARHGHQQPSKGSCLEIILLFSCGGGLEKFLHWTEMKRLAGNTFADSAWSLLAYAPVSRQPVAPSVIRRQGVLLEYTCAHNLISTRVTGARNLK
eukprot:GHVT01063320.1.p1 GENE.GHVT01063320.1~~GHVT01063320.1.p1  ORF type:complete len:124 (+),score=5.04 GHVT01063320.1:621-992(+)